MSSGYAVELEEIFESRISSMTLPSKSYIPMTESSNLIVAPLYSMAERCQKSRLVTSTLMHPLVIPAVS